jgi:hypothetical protein
MKNNLRRHEDRSVPAIDDASDGCLVDNIDVDSGMVDSWIVDGFMINGCMVDGCLVDGYLVLVRRGPLGEE